MATLVTFLILLVAASLEAAGDALVRNGLHSHGLAVRLGFFACGAAVLFIYGLTVNAPPWDFGKLLGVYVALFFAMAQLINAVAYGVRPGPPIWVGGGLIVAGGLVITVWRG